MSSTRKGVSKSKKDVVKEVVKDVVAAEPVQPTEPVVASAVVEKPVLQYPTYTMDQLRAFVLKEKEVKTFSIRLLDQSRAISDGDTFLLLDEEEKVFGSTRVRFVDKIQLVESGQSFIEVYFTDLFVK